MDKQKVVSLEERVPKLKEKRKQKTNRQLTFFVILFFLLILIIIYLQTPLSKVSNIVVEGAVNVPKETVIKLSGITTETSFWKIEEDKTVAAIKENKQIKEVDIQKRFPSTVILSIEENERVAYVFKDSAFYPILENGGFLEKQKQLTVPDAPILIDWKKPEMIQAMSAQLKKLPSSIANAISEIHLTPSNTDEEQITVYMSDGNEVIATISTFASKMKSYPQIISQIDPNIKGTVHFEVGSYFEAYNKEDLKSNEEENSEHEENEG
ncbi:FtsQ-type POTRA domain-containing protein [Bacillus sp. FJAT-47783]|uniref:cell division protein FtsQ/DivIB n=1 Tax=Bacillus sp. FJAT-47783 TaxID=2922712 RepID=UPI001FABD452|nr:FtsQ-type POTRA domain-containing protein [Bacillus sp. FJAT-47783]